MKTIRFTKQAIADMTHPGPCDADVREYLAMPRYARQIAKLDPAMIARYLKEFGAWDADELADDEANQMRLLWIAAGDCREEQRCTFYFSA